MLIESTIRYYDDILEDFGGTPVGVPLTTDQERMRNIYQDRERYREARLTIQELPDQVVDLFFDRKRSNIEDTRRFRDGAYAFSKNEESGQVAIIANPSVSPLPDDVLAKVYANPGKYDIKQIGSEKSLRHIITIMPPPESQ